MRGCRKLALDSITSISIEDHYEGINDLEREIMDYLDKINIEMA